MAKRGRKPTHRGRDSRGRTREEIREENVRQYNRRRQNRVFVKCECDRQDCRDDGRHLIPDSITKTRRLNDGKYICRSCKAKMAIERKGGISRETKEKISRSVCKRIVDGDLNPSHNAIQSWVPSSKALGGLIYCRSSYEEAFVIELEKNPKVSSIQAEPESIPYIFNGQERGYIPDFLVTLITGTKILFEIKPTSQTGYDENLAKWEAARTLCVDRGMRFEIITEDDLNISKKRHNRAMKVTRARFDPVFEKHLLDGEGLNGEIAAQLIGRSKSVGTKYWRLYRRDNQDRLVKDGVLYYLKPEERECRTIIAQRERGEPGRSNVQSAEEGS